MQYEYNLTGVGVMSRFPYVSLGNCMGLNCKNPGAEVEFLMTCLQLINATITINPTLVEHKHVLQMLANGSADISIKTINQEIPRQEQVDFTVPTGIVYLGYYIKENTKVEVGDYLAGAFPGTVVLMVAAASLIVSCLLHFFAKVLRKNSSSVGDYEYFALAGLLRNSNFNQKPVCSRLLVAVWLLFSFMLTEYYNAKLRSLLMTTHYRGAFFTNLDEAMDAMEYQGWKMVINTTDYSPLSYCHSSQCGRLRKLYKRNLVLEYINNVSLEVAAEADRQFGFGGLQGDLVPHERSVLNEAKRILFVRDQLITPAHRSYAVRKNMSVLLDKLNQIIAYTFNGLPTIRSRYTRPYQPYVNKHFQENANVLTISHITILFEWTGGLLSTAFACFIGEIICFRYFSSFLQWIRRTQHRNVLGSASGNVQNSIELTHFSNITG
ncbi:unnamed protein product [Cylicocyclus nassatus]|uniref:Ionotropic glutamate receptor C-terminal domain-containing protein n=1 Tax=Cylicocyclus nassatus TaxID=53992 RepID=A0AA36H7W5_CYLNA|nr:unnamed protein product [Cylicocyclus nassatus]